MSGSSDKILVINTIINTKTFCIEDSTEVCN